MILRLAVFIAAFFALLAPALAQDDDSIANTPVLSSSLRGLAPADEYFGRYNLSVLGIANNIRDAGTRIDTGGDIHAHDQRTAHVCHRCDQSVGAAISERSVDRKGSARARGRVSQDSDRRVLPARIATPPKRGCARIIPTRCTRRRDASSLPTALRVRRRNRSCCSPSSSNNRSSNRSSCSRSCTVK